MRYTMTPTEHAVQTVRDVLRAGIKPHVSAIARHHGVRPPALAIALRGAGIPQAAGRMSREDMARHEALFPRVDLRAQAPVPVWSEALRGSPPHLELEDACAVWGIRGAAEEYEVSEEQVCAWLRAHGMRAERTSEGGGSMSRTCEVTP